MGFFWERIGMGVFVGVRAVGKGEGWREGFLVRLF